MRDTSDMMEDALSEDTMMDCGGDDGGLEDLVDLATDIADSSPTIRDAAERLLTLLGVDDDNDDLSSSLEDEGVEVDVDEIEDEDEEEPENTRLLHQLAASLAQELKYSQRKQNHPKNSLQNRTTFENREHQTMETGQDDSFLDNTCTVQTHNFFDRGNKEAELSFSRSRFSFSNFRQDRQDSLSSFSDESKESSSLDSSPFACLDHRLRVRRSENEKSRVQADLSGSWGAGWDACATEALRYLVEDEGLPPHHPTVVAMKNHLDIQRERAFVQYTA